MNFDRKSISWKFFVRIMKPRTKLSVWPVFSSNSFQFFGSNIFGDGGMNMSFGIGAFPFGFMATTFNIGGAAHQNCRWSLFCCPTCRPSNPFPSVSPLSANNEVGTEEEQFMSKLFMWIAVLFIIWLLIAWAEHNWNSTASVPPRKAPKNVSQCPPLRNPIPVRYWAVVLSPASCTSIISHRWRCVGRAPIAHCLTTQRCLTNTCKHFNGRLLKNRKGGLRKWLNVLFTLSSFLTNHW